jgi:hypothetical protein
MNVSEANPVTTPCAANKRCFQCLPKDTFYVKGKPSCALKRVLAKTLSKLILILCMYAYLHT